jgi:hypothetical protein
MNVFTAVGVSLTMGGGFIVLYLAVRTTEQGERIAETGWRTAVRKKARVTESERISCAEIGVERVKDDE